MICPNCANRIDDKATFCPNCGILLNSDTVEYYDSDSSYSEETMPMMPPINEMPSTEFCLKCGRVLKSGQLCNCSSYAPSPCEYDDSETEKTRIDNSVGYVSSKPLGPTYDAPPVYVHREEPMRGYPVPPPPPPTPERKPATGGREFFKTVNKL